jgi:hypothetical protein
MTLAMLLLRLRFCDVVEAEPCGPAFWRGWLMTCSAVLTPTDSFSFLVLLFCYLCTVSNFIYVPRSKSDVLQNVLMPREYMHLSPYEEGKFY